MYTGCCYPFCILRQKVEQKQKKKYNLVYENERSKTKTLKNKIVNF